MANGRRRRKFPKPREGVCGDLDRKGRGVIVEGLERPMHVEGAMAGERVIYRRKKRRGDYDEGLLVEVLEPSLLRVEPPCTHYEICGGCKLQHMGAEQQISHKQAVLLDGLRDLGGVEPSRILPPLRGPTTGYRRRARLGVRKVDKKGKVLVGFREKGGRLVADLLGCEILLPPGGELIPKLSLLVAAMSIANAVPQIEVSVGDDAIGLTLRVLEDPSENDLELLRAFALAEGLRIYLQRGGLETVAPLDGEEPLLHYDIPELDLRLGFLPTDFVQVNGVMNRAVVSMVMELMDLQSDHRVLDLFCGLGNFTLPLARRSHSVVGIEGDDGLVQRGRDNARRNEIENVRFEVGDLYGKIESASWLDGRYDRILIDPPRTGAEAVVARLGALGANKIVYVACGPDSLARDAGVLVREYGYRLEAAGIMDMFPHTAHVESVALFVHS